MLSGIFSAALSSTAIARIVRDSSPPEDLILINDLAACVDQVTPYIVLTMVDKCSHDVVKELIDLFVMQRPRNLLEQAKTH